MPHARALPRERADLAADPASGFLTEMSALMGLPEGSGRALRAPASFRGFAGFMCRLRLAPPEERVAVRPEVLLPISARELTGPDIERLLALQEALMVELGWAVGLSCEGLLQLSPLNWIGEPGAAVAALDLGQALCRDALDEIIGALPFHEGPAHND